MCCNKLKTPKGIRLKQNREVIFFPMGVPFVQVLVYEGSGLTPPLGHEMEYKKKKKQPNK
jgi:hypothetical protein